MNAELINLLREGVPVPEIARRTGTTRQNVHSTAKRAGIAPAKASRRRGPSPRTLAILAELEAGKLVTEVARERGIAVDIVSKALTSHAPHLSRYRHVRECAERRDANPPPAEPPPDPADIRALLPILADGSRVLADNPRAARAAEWLRRLAGETVP